MQLLKMTDYVLEQINNAPLEEYHQVNETFVNKVINYAKFLKKPLKLEMFVPCLGYGEPFNEFQLDALNSDDEIPELRLEYKKAKEKVLFEEFEYKSDIEYFWIFSLNGKSPTTIPKKFTLENLANNSILDLELTESAINQINQ